MKISHRESETDHTAAILEEIPAMFCDVLRWSAMPLDAQNRRKKAHFHRSMWQGLNVTNLRWSYTQVGEMTGNGIRPF